MVFPPWARIALGLLVALLGYLVAGEIPMSEDWRTAVSMITVFLASVGVVPPRPGDFVLSPGLSVALTAVGQALTFVVTTVDGLDITLQGVLVAVLALLASVGIAPPQAKPG